MNKDSSQLIAVVTGASSGLGLECSKLLSGRGIPVCMVARRQEVLRDAASKVKTGDSPVYTMAADVGSPHEVQRVRRFVDEEGLQVKWLLNIAGVGRFKEVDRYTSNDIEEVMKGNLLGVILMSQQFLDQLSQNEGVLCNVMSTAALVGRAKETVYCAAKWGARGFTEALMAEFKKKSPRIMAVYPGGMNTPFWDASRDYVGDPSRFMSPDVVADRIVSNILDASQCQVSSITIDRL